MEDTQKKMTRTDWFILFQVAIIFDALGWVLALGIDEVLFGVPGVLLNLIAGIVFLTFALLWRDKGIGNLSYFKSFGVGFLIEEIPILGTILPTWTAFIYKARSNYEQKNNPTSAMATVGKVTS
ncbi:MAG TPA: hypothetical protein P5056_03265 [Candidatus Paceibacterota bacterium]|nr:hypothetical protein [Candidatus Paceibacterota bacterium]